MKVEVYDDIACPWCRLGTHQFHRAVATAGLEPEVELVHRPYQLMPDAPEEPRSLMDTTVEMNASGIRGDRADEDLRAGLQFRTRRVIAAEGAKPISAALSIRGCTAAG